MATTTIEIPIPGTTVTTYTGTLSADTILEVNANGTAQDVTVVDTSRVNLNMSGRGNNLTVQSKGKVYSYAGSIATNVTLKSGGLYYMMGGKLTGSVSLAGTVYAKKSSGGIASIIDFDVKNDKTPNTALYSNLSKVKVYNSTTGKYTLALGEEGTAAQVSLTINVNDGRQEGDYLLAANAPVTLDGAEFTLHLFGKSAAPAITVNGATVSTTYADYKLTLNASNELWLNIVRKPGDPIVVTSMEQLAEEIAANPLSILNVKFDSASAVEGIVAFHGYMAEITSGTFNNVVTGGISNATGKARTDSKAINLTINGGTFNAQVAGSDQLAAAGSVTHAAATTFTITGGDFSKSVAGGLLNSLAEGGVVTQNADIHLTISGGSFASHVVGGNLNAKVATANQARSIINGNVYTTLDSSTNAISIGKSLVAGSWGKGAINGDVSVTLTGTKAVTIGADLWGGCSSDKYIRKNAAPKTGDRNFSTFITGSRTLSFTGFGSTLTCNAIGGFDTLVVEDDSTVALVKTEGAETNFALGDIRNWTFELGSTLTGDFGNNFTMDNMTITGSAASLTTAGTTLISNGNAKAFIGFTGMDSVTLFTESATYDKAQGMYISNTYKLYVDGTDMKVATLA